MDNKVFPLHFSSAQPSAYDWLGSIQWELPKAICSEHGELKADEVVFGSQYYDGYNWAVPQCVHCTHWLTDYAYPMDLHERKVYFEKRPNVIAAKLWPIQDGEK